MDRKDRELLNKLREFPRHEMDEDKEQEIHQSLLRMTKDKKVISQKERKNRFIARIATVAALILFSVLGISYLQKDSSPGLGQQGESSLPLVENEAENEEIDNEMNNEFVNEEENYEEDLAWEPMGEEKIKIIINETLHHFLLRVEEIQLDHPEWFEKFSLLHEGGKEYPEEFREAVELFKERLEPIFTKEALEEYVEGIIVISFCECDSYTLWSKEDTEKGFQVKDQSEDSFLVTSIVEATELDPHNWKYEWEFKKEGVKWKLNLVTVEEIIE